MSDEKVTVEGLADGLLREVKQAREGFKLSRKERPPKPTKVEAKEARRAARRAGGVTKAERRAAKRSLPDR